MPAVVDLQGCTAAQRPGLRLRNACGPCHPVHGGCAPGWLPYGGLAPAVNAVVPVPNLVFVHDATIHMS